MNEMATERLLTVRQELPQVSKGCTPGVFMVQSAFQPYSIELTDELFGVSLYSLAPTLSSGVSCAIRPKNLQHSFKTILPWRCPNHFSRPLPPTNLFFILKLSIRSLLLLCSSPPFFFTIPFFFPVMRWMSIFVLPRL
jgi:hypothetical protein